MKAEFFRFRQGGYMECNVCRNYSFDMVSLSEDEILIAMVTHIRESHPLRYEQLKERVEGIGGIVAKIIESIEEEESNLADQIRKDKKENHD